MIYPVNFFRSTCHVFTALVLFSMASSCAHQTINGNRGAVASSPSAEEKFGVLVMAHGGSAQWNTSVLDLTERLRRQYPVEVAFGMADATTMEHSVRNLEKSGVSHVGVVRLFVSGESWYERTLQIFGLMEGAPPKSAVMESMGDMAQSAAKPAMHHPKVKPLMSMGFWKIDTDLTFAISTDGLADAEEMNAVLESRAASLSNNPSKEAVLVLAHGPGDDAENRRWIKKIKARTQALASRMNFHDVKVFTLREDWPEKRRKAEQRIREYITVANREGIVVIVLPYRIHGFGPYTKVLTGLDYRANKKGLLPHDNVTDWLEKQASAIRASLLK